MQGGEERLPYLTSGRGNCQCFFGGKYDGEEKGEEGKADDGSNKNGKAQNGSNKNGKAEKGKAENPPEITGCSKETRPEKACAERADC